MKSGIRIRSCTGSPSHIGAFNAKCPSVPNIWGKHVHGLHVQAPADAHVTVRRLRTDVMGPETRTLGFPGSLEILSTASFFGVGPEVIVVGPGFKRWNEEQHPGFTYQSQKRLVFTRVLRG